MVVQDIWTSLWLLFSIIVFETRRILSKSTGSISEIHSSNFMESIYEPFWNGHRVNARELLVVTLTIWLVYNFFCCFANLTFSIYDGEKRNGQFVFTEVPAHLWILGHLEQCGVPLTDCGLIQVLDCIEQVSQYLFKHTA